MIAFIGWGLFAALALAWARAHVPWRRFVRGLGRVALLAAVATVVLLAYLVHSQVLRAGTHVDAVYTWVGLAWALALQGPITFIARTPSYPQSPLMVLAHAPGMAVGFARLGPLAMHLGVLLTVAGLLALMATVIAPGAGLLRQAVAVALAAGCVSTRFFVQGYDAVGYTVAGVSLGCALLAVLAVEDEAVRHRLVGGMVALATLHYAFVGLALAVPLCLAWLLLRRHPVRALRAFARVNAVPALVFVLLAISIATHPELFLVRAHDVVSGPGMPFWPAVQRKLTAPLATLSSFPRFWWLHWYVVGEGSWHLVDLPPLGGPTLWLLAATWLCSAIVAPRGIVRFVASAIGFIVVLGALSLLQHVLTDPSDYRDFPFVLAVFVGGLVFVLRAPALSGARGAVAWLTAVAVAAVAWRDVPTLRDHRHLAYDYAPKELAVFELLRQATATHSHADLGATRIAVVTEAFFPLRATYVDLLAARGYAVTPVNGADFCRDRDAAVRGAAAASCEPFLLAHPANICQRDRSGAADVPVVFRYESACPEGLDPTTGRRRTLRWLGDIELPR